MKKTIRYLALLLALCLSLCACGGKAEETTEPTTKEDQLAELIFAEDIMQGLEHYGLGLNADQATTEQVLMATAMINLHDHELIEGTKHLYGATAYAYMPLADGNWYVPLTFVLPSNEEGDNIHIGGIDCLRADWGRQKYSTQFVNMKMTEDELAGYTQTEGWEELSVEQVHMFALLQEYLAQMGLSVESENVVSQLDDDTVFSYCIRSGEEGDVMSIINLHFYQACADGSKVIACTMIDGILVKQDAEQIVFDLNEDENAAFQEFMKYTGFFSWFEIAE